MWTPTILRMSCRKAPAQAPACLPGAASISMPPLDAASGKAEYGALDLPAGFVV